MSVKESALEDRCMEYLVAHGGYHTKLHHGQGHPDRLMAYNSLALIEFKRQGEKPRELQQEVHKMWEMAGARVYTVDSFDGFLRVLRGM